MVGRMVLVVVSACAPAVAQGVEPAPYARAAEALARSVVRVRYTMRYDRGQPPEAFAETLDLRIPHEEPGFLIAPDLVVTEDLMLPERFVERVEVYADGRIIPARPVGYGTTQDAMYLHLAEAPAGLTPMRFIPDAPGPWLAGQYVPDEDLGWIVQVGPMPQSVTIREGGPPFIAVPTQTVVMTERGEPVALTMRAELPVDGSWRTPPTEWDRIDQAAYLDLLERTRERVEAGVLHATALLRSPRTMPGPRGFQSTGEDLTRWDGSAVVIGEVSALVLAPFPPSVTARLERVRLALPDGRSVGARFAGSLRDYGAFLVRTDEPIGPPVALTDRPIETYRDRLLIRADVLIQGERRTVDVSREWFRAYVQGWRGMWVPQRLGATYLERSGDPLNVPASLEFPFDLDGALVAIPIHLRGRPDERAPRTLLLPAPALAALLADADGAVDPGNVPLPEESENRVAWLGVELQPLDQELARLKGVADQTGDGRTGAIVSVVYEGSPAAEMGLQVGDVLLRVTAEGDPRPLDVALYDARPGMDEFWNVIDQIPDAYFAQIPTPWSPADNAFNRMLTALGAGRACVLEFARDGEVHARPFRVRLGPDHFGSARRYEHAGIGLTVAEMTYEVRRYFRVGPDDPGVVIAKVEEGSRASVAGLKPYEYITHVDDVPVASVEAFQEAMESADGEVRLAVRRMGTGRIVKVRLP